MSLSIIPPSPSAVDLHTGVNKTLAVKQSDVDAVYVSPDDVKRENHGFLVNGEWKKTGLNVGASFFSCFFLIL